MMDGWMGWWMDGWVGGWMDGWVDGYAFRNLLLYRRCNPQFVVIPYNQTILTK